MTYEVISLKTTNTIAEFDTREEAQGFVERAAKLAGNPPKLIIVEFDGEGMVVEAPGPS